mmetsp:Transcript_23126/g.41810  ORF Transcript_23126/g.41810 Transcript_23126/m.41810 type:complete len:387 (-) Transcript_23126:325-1485(-)|eukprot:CAMPEP_0197627286 /NCGR_PEP_ID=MMETSP1338-20131121/5936_1 /TAXON_ID=43686 ORGANISM="Pelagodinium beii, Strain RCC1491" /NCGR_SAMPLE_ID=MMETSP1338 /ASSEMBLY_ACC=CAM_ASM_000754 /LENGTH=386 /DNA_ID=CAMNT_0043197969 /DNA_START=99 /DNA_END=1259 /DNA_ORIENTATION=+
MDGLDTQAELVKLREAVAKLEEGLRQIAGERNLSIEDSEGTEDLPEHEVEPILGRCAGLKRAALVSLVVCIIGGVAYVLLLPTRPLLVVGGPHPQEWNKVTANLFDNAVLIDMVMEFLRAFNCVTVAFLAAILSTVGSSLVVTFKPHHLPADFNEKGTLSNVSQHVETPWGRLFAVSLFTAGLLLLMSNYTFWLYPAWSTDLDISENPLALASLASYSERRWRVAWMVVPSVGFMITAAIPSFSTITDVSWILTLVHNITAPCSVAFMVSMESVQLSYGEHAFALLFGTREDSDSLITESYASLDFAARQGKFQRLRAVLCILAWLAAAVFLSLQVYLGLHSVLGLKVPTSYRLASVSYYSEVFGLCLAFALPFTAALARSLDMTL